MSAMRRESGFSVIAAIFLLVVLAALGGYMATFSGVQHITSAQDVQGTRAYWAARAAAEYGLMQVLAPEDTSGATSFQNCMALPQTVALPAPTGFTVRITGCERQPAAGNYTEGSVNLVVYRITALASSGVVGTPGYVEREITVSAEKCKDPNATLPDGTPDNRNRC